MIQWDLFQRWFYNLVTRFCYSIVDLEKKKKKTGELLSFLFLLSDADPDGASFYSSADSLAVTP